MPTNRHLSALPHQGPVDPSPGPGKRGRRQGVVDPAAGPVAELAHELAMLKLAAGDPSYDQMRRDLGAQASKSALSAAARGADLPSWETTWEFVRCLAPAGTDLHELRSEWRGRWESARDTTDVPGSDGLRAADERKSLSRWTAIAAPVAVVVVGLGAWFVVRGDDDAPAPPLPGDSTFFVGDVTVPDGTEVDPGETFVKVWELRNSGRVPWEGRYFQRQPDSQGDCRSVGRFPVPATQPGEPVRVGVTVIAPAQPGRCKVYWKMVDEQGRMFFPDRRAMYYQVVVPG
ncbi:MAG: NBR1-Ig-like domain-containing protein [Acidimicrobiia bacterium]